MATDYDAPRKNDDEPEADSIEELTSRLPHMRLAEQEFSFRTVGHKVAQAMRAPLREPRRRTGWESWLDWFGGAR